MPDLDRLPTDANGDPRPAGYGCPDLEIPICFEAMVEAMDTEIGRLLAALRGLPRETTVIFVGDNGTHPLVTRHGRSKGTLYQGGVHVPLIIQGPGVTVSESGHLANTSDLFATVLELASGQDPRLFLGPEEGVDSYSLVPPAQGGTNGREFTYAERTQVLGPFDEGWGFKDFGKTIADQTYKLITRPDGDEFYDLSVDPTEDTNLIDDPDHQVAIGNLRAELDRLTSGSLNFCPPDADCRDCNAAARSCFAAPIALASQNLGPEACVKRVEFGEDELLECPGDLLYVFQRCQSAENCDIASWKLFCDDKGT